MSSQKRSSSTRRRAASTSSGGSGRRESHKKVTHWSGDRCSLIEQSSDHGAARRLTARSLNATPKFPLRILRSVSSSKTSISSMEKGFSKRGYPCLSLSSAAPATFPSPVRDTSSIAAKMDGFMISPSGGPNRQTKPQCPSALAPSHNQHGSHLLYYKFFPCGRNTTRTSPIPPDSP